MNRDVYRFLVDTLGADAVLCDEPLSAHTTFRIGGPAEFFVSPANEQQVASVVRYCNQQDIPLHVLGRGSNVLVADKGIAGVVLHLGPRFSHVEIDKSGCVRAQAGASNGTIARLALDAGLAGFEFAAGIPGTIGGAAMMNAGAYGGELKDVATNVTCLSREGELCHVTADEAGWAYRTSAFARDGSIVLAVELALQPSEQAEIKALMDDFAARRREKQPLELPSVGSTFKRPEGYFAGKLIQDAGLQGRAVGGAEVSTKHAGFIVNTGNASAHDVKQLIDEVIATVSATSGVVLQPEVRFWGF